MPYIVFPSFDMPPLLASSRRKVVAATLVPKTAGIIGGLGSQSTTLFYDAATRYCLDRNLPAIPRLLINSVNTWAVTRILADKDLEGLYHFLKKEIALIQDQVDFLIMVCNSVHAVLEPIREMLDIPVLSIYEEVCKEVAQAPVKKVGILATKTTVDNNFYQYELEKYGIEWAVLPSRQVAALDAFIFDEALYNRGEEQMKSLLLGGIDFFKEQGCQGVILACTELPLFISQEDTDMPLFMSTHILAHSVIEECIGI